MNRKNSCACVTEVKDRNVNLVRDALRNIDSGTKQTIAQMTGLSITTCNTILNELYRDGEVVLLDSKCVRGTGRPAKTYQLNRSFHYVCCFYSDAQHDADNSYYHYVILDTVCKTVDQGSFPCIRYDYDEINQLLSHLIEQFPEISIICFCVSGTYLHNIWNNSWTFKALNGLDVPKLLSESLKRHVIVENDMNAVAYGIYHEKKKENSSLSSLASIAFFHNSSFGDNRIQNGAGLVYNGSIIRGHYNFAGEIGFLPLKSLDTLRASETSEPDLVSDFGADLLHILSVTTNPEVCYFVGESINCRIVEDIQRKCAERIDARFITRAEYLADYQKYFIIGLYHIALDYMNLA